MVYYRGPTAEVTNEHFVHYSADGQDAFAIAEISDVTTEALDGPWWRLWRRSRGFRLRAWHRGMVVVIYEHPDPRVFNMVCRALRRALENHPGNHY
ncbi:hypothetical protein SAMN04489716_1379 [Actinoplanes derwentensis]|uniref:Uncharacterized protein n=1 Tax=Actinoplanes derwentensis TaxID=113562 RepID=A0A1H1UA34_9ACTN|nr:hypothetical protein SAMN04489716_1379 [Actinoplanes derwentensis]